MNGWKGVEVALDVRVYLHCGSRFDLQIISVICDGQEIDFAPIECCYLGVHMLE